MAPKTVRVPDLRKFNRRLGRTGSLWQGRYKAKYVENQSYLDRLVLYVHLNPVKTGLVEDPKNCQHR